MPLWALSTIWLLRLANAFRSGLIPTLDAPSNSTSFTPAVKSRIKSLCFLTKRFKVLTLFMTAFHSCIGYNSKQLLNTLLLSTNASCISGASCFFSAAGRLMRPFASILHSCTPMRFNMCFWLLSYKSRILVPRFPTNIHIVNNFWR